MSRQLVMQNVEMFSQRFEEMRGRLIGWLNSRKNQTDQVPTANSNHSNQIPGNPVTPNGPNGTLRRTFEHYYQQYVPVAAQQMLQQFGGPQFGSTQSSDEPDVQHNSNNRNIQIHSQRIVDGFKQGKAVAKQKLNAIAPVEYVTSLRRLSKPMLENEKLSQVLTKLKQAKTTTKRPAAKWYFISGSVLMAFSLLMFAAQDELVQKAMNYGSSELKENNLAIKKWQSTPVNFCIYFMGLANGEAFTEGARPYIVEHGPFCYRMSQKRRVLEWKKNTVRYKERTNFTFDPETSQSLDTKINMINYPIFIGVGLARNILDSYYISFLGPIVYNGITVILRMTGEGLVDQTTARELLEGKSIGILAYVDLFLQVFRSIGVSVPNAQHSFGFITLSSLEVGPFEVYRRTEKHHLAGDVYSFQEQTTFPTWPSPCNRMKAGTGMFWRRPVTATRLYLFASAACRLIRFIRQEAHYYRGAQVIRYNLDSQMFNMSLRRNRCFCAEDKTLADCDGFQDISPCLGGLPIGLSFPHFYNSPSRLKQVDGLKPSTEEHQSYLDMEPLIAVPVRARVGLQVLVDIQPYTLVPSLSDMPTVQLPIVYIKVHAGADGALGALLFIGSNVVRYGSYAWLVVGGGFSGLLFALGSRRRLRSLK